MIVQCACGETVPVTHEELLVAVDELAQTVVGRKTLRDILRRHDKRVQADKSGPKTPRVNAPSIEAPLTVKLGHHFAFLRKKRNLTQLQLADKIGVKNFTLLRWEAGVTFPNFDMYEQWAKALGTTVRDAVIEATE